MCQICPGQKIEFIFGSFLKWRYPQIIPFNRIFHYEASILGYPPFLESICTYTYHAHINYPILRYGHESMVIGIYIPFCRPQWFGLTGKLYRKPPFFPNAERRVLVYLWGSGRRGCIHSLFRPTTVRGPYGGPLGNAPEGGLEGGVGGGGRGHSGSRICLVLPMKCLIFLFRTDSHVCASDLTYLRHYCGQEKALCLTRVMSPTHV